MQNAQSNGIQLAQSNLDAVVAMSAHATIFWRRCASLQAQSANHALEEGLRVARAILRTQSEMVDAASQFLSEGQRLATENIEQAARESGGNGELQALKPAPRAAQHAGSQAHRRAS